MALFNSVPSVIILIVIIALNVLSCIYGGKISLVLTLTSVALNIAIAPVMLFEACPLSELALVYLASFFAYIFSLYIVKKKGEHRDL